MKRMNLIHGALFAVLTFMGSISLSAQNWYPAPQAITVLNAKLALLSEPPVVIPASTTTGSGSKQNASNEAKSGCADCLLKGVKFNFIMLVLQKIKEGNPVGTSVEEVHAFFLNNANNYAPLIQTIEDANEYMVDILSN